MAFTKTMRPETLERRAREAEAKRLARRDAFAGWYAVAAKAHGFTTPMPDTGCTASVMMPDGTEVTVTANGYCRF